MTEAEVELALIDHMAKFTHDPLGYVKFAFPWGEAGTELADQTGPRSWQRKVLERMGALLRDGKTRYAVIQEAIASGHGIGKSALIAWVCKWALDTCEDTKVVITANTQQQLLTKTSPELAKWHRLSITSHWFTFTATALYSTDPEHEKTWRADLVTWSENNTEAFAGLHNAGKRLVLLFDEASAIADKVWEVAEGALTDAMTEIMWFVFGNPTRATGRFRECFRKFRHRWHGEHIDSRTVEGVNVEQLQKMVDDNGEDSDIVKVRVRGMFPAASLKSFFSESDVDPAYGRHLRDDQFSWAPKIISVDGSWEGDDPLVIGLRQGLMFKILKCLPKNDNDVWVANLVARLEDELEADAVFIDGGFGTGIVSVGRTLQRAWRLVWFAEESADKGCLNKRAEMAKLTRDWLREGGAIEMIPQLREDLLGPETVARLDGKLQLESKKEMKLRGLPSPNHGDALFLSFAYPVASKRHDLAAVNGGGRAVCEEWN
jgi:hypothetical protein